MKPLALILAILCATAACHAATLGPEVAIMQLKFPKEKQPREVVIGLYDEATPATVENFKTLINRKFYNGLRFHRAFPGSLVQTGAPGSRWGQKDKTGTGGPGYTIPAEIRLKHDKGAIAMARLPDPINPAKQSNGSQFYVCLEPLPKLNGQYTVFGTVLEGLDVLEEISKATTNSNDFPLPKITIKSLVLAPRDQASPTR